MYSLNRATILGNVTRDPEVRQIPSGQSVCTFGVATNRSWTDGSGQRQEQVEFHSVVAWGKLADICGQYLAKGRKVYVEGRLQTRDWEGQDGVKRYRTEIIADNVILLDRPPAGAGEGSEGFAAGSASSSAPRPPADEPAMDPETEIKVEDIPF
ncbi:single-stranded DNA-binding protein [Candidatus Uhrbacteria bacterium]|nr:single-stranded DNA-binding protein [Candidatus Uhrbacteria bacterium]